MLTSRDRPAKLLFVIGTRPEAIKLAPVILLAQRDATFHVRICATAQHRELLDAGLRIFGLNADWDLNVMTCDQQPAFVASQITRAVAEVVERERPSWVVVQGDTVSTFASSLAAFYSRVPVAHVEAGLRTYDASAPWPEELNRQMTTRLATLHFAPTERARQNLLDEGVPAAAVEVTGNTVVDAVRLIRDGTAQKPAHGIVSSLASPDQRLVLVTVHRRENLGPRLDAVLQAVVPIVEAVDDATVVIVDHRNPNARRGVEDFRRRTGEHPRIRIVDPLAYDDFLDLLARCHVVLTDSGGIQEEAPLFGTPVLVLREVTERPELLSSGGGCLVGSDTAMVVEQTVRLLTDSDHHRAMSRPSSPFGDGRASERILAKLGRSSSD